MKKFFRRSLACIIAIVMIATTLPFSAITVGAATENKTIERKYLGVYAASSKDRTATNGFYLVNDSQSSNFSVGYITFDISGIDYTEAKRISATYTFNINVVETESLGVSVYYPTKNVDSSFAANGQPGTPGNIWSKDDGNHISRAKDYWGLKHIASYPTKANANLGRTVDLGPAIVAAKKAGKSTATIVFMLSKAGGSGGTNGYSDSTITCSNATASVTIYDFSDRNFIAYEATKYGSFSDDSDSLSETEYNNSYKNVLYAPNNMQEAYLSGAKSAEGKDKIYLNSHIFYGNTVLLYNGNTVPQFPIGFAITGYSKPWNYYWDNVRSHYCRISDGANGLTIQNKKWKGRDGRNNVQYILNAQAEVDVYSDNTSVGYKQGEKGYYANIMQYTGGDFQESYKKINPNFEYKVGTNEGTPQVHTTGSVSGKSIYVLNYKKIVDKVNSVNSFLSTFDDSIYDTTTLNAYYNAIYKMFAFDPSLYDYDANTEQAVKDAANDMDSLIAAVDTAYNNLKLKKVTVSFRTQTNNVIENRVIEYGSKIGAFPSNSAPQTHNDDPFFIDEGKHVRFSWPTGGYTADTVVTSDITIKEVSNAESCTGTATCTAKAICTVCGLPFGAIDPDNHDPTYEFKDYTKHIKRCSRCDKLNVEEAHTDDGTGKCTLCRGTIIDKTALNAAIATAKPIYDPNNTDGTYVTESFNEFKAVYERVVAANPTTQEEVNSLTAELTTATNTLRKTTLTVQFDIVTDTTVTENSTASYGEVKEFTVTDGDVEEWVIVTDNGTDQPVTTTSIKTGENTISLVITRNVHVTAQIAKNGTTKPNITKVVFRGRNNAVVAIKYIEANASLATAGVAVPTIPFYHADAWDKTEVIGLANGGEITVRAQYTFNGTETDKCGIHFEKFGDGGVKKFNYDTLVKLNDTRTYYGMYEDEAKTKLLTYFETDEFYAPHNPNVYVYALDSKPTTATVGVTGSYSGIDNDAGKKFATFNCKFYVPEGATVLEWGIKATAGGKTITFKSDTKSRRNEYSFRINFAQSLPITSVDAQAYIIYELGGTRKTVFSNNTVTQSF